MKLSVEYLGHSVDSEGLHTLPSKVEAIQQAPQPQNVQQLRSFLGLLNYYGKFISNLADIIHPLNQLLHKDAKWMWNQVGLYTVLEWRVPQLLAQLLLCMFLVQY